LIKRTLTIDGSHASIMLHELQKWILKNTGGSLLVLFFVMFVFASAFCICVTQQSITIS